MVSIDGSYLVFFSYIFVSLVCIGTLEEALVIHRILETTMFHNQKNYFQCFLYVS